MDGLVIPFVAVQAIALPVVLGVAWSRGGALDGIDESRGRGRAAAATSCTSTASASGTGLGLAIARHIVEGHGGTIRVESGERNGARFAFTVPVSDAPHTTPTARTPSGAAHA